MRKDEFYRTRRKDEISEFKLRPKFEIIDYKRNMGNPGYIEEEFDIDCLVTPIKSYSKDGNSHIFDYDPIFKDKKNWVSLTFRLKNIGKSEISNLYFCWNSPRNTSLFDVKNDEYIFYIDYKDLNYRVLLDKAIKSGDEISIKINFHKNFVTSGFMSAEASIWMFDEYNNIWHQPLFVHHNKIYDSTKVTFSDFKNLTDIDDAIKCFENPYLW